MNSNSYEKQRNFKIRYIESLINKKSLHIAEEECIKAIASNRIDPQYWKLLGETMFYEGFGATAARCLERAYLLDPKSSWINDLKEKMQLIPQKLKNNVENILSVCGITVTACIIARNEERCIGKCLDKIQNAVDEIILVDTGSTDRTIEIAKKYDKVKMFNYQWKEDFSDARNFALSKVKTQWVIFVDADEYLVQEDIGVIRETAALFNNLNPQYILTVMHLNKSYNNQVLITYDVARMFQSEKGTRFEGRIHEQVVPDKKSFLKSVRIRFEHDGYSEEVLKSKGKYERNLRLLEKSIRDEPDNLMNLMFYGRELINVSYIDKGIEVLEKTLVLKEKNSDFERWMDIFDILIRNYISIKKFHQAEKLCIKALKEDESFPDTWYYLGEVNVENKNFDKAEECFRKAEECHVFYKGLTSSDNTIFQWKIEFSRADIIKLQGNLEEAKRRYIKFLDVPVAKDLAKKSIELIDEEMKSYDEKNNNPFFMYPVEVSIETTGRCNAKCEFCPHETLDRKNSEMSESLFLKIISDLKEMPKSSNFTISPFKVNEPLMDRSFFKKAEIINKELPNASIRFFSNFNMARDEDIQALKCIKNLKQIWISLNSMDEYEYRRVMGLNLNRTLNNIEKLLQFNLENNLVNKIDISRVMDNTEADQTFLDKLLERFKEYKDMINPMLLHRGEWINHNEFNYINEVEKTPCYRWNEVSITCTGKVSFCCMDGKCEYPLGDLNYESVLDVYNNPSYKKLRTSMCARELIEPCKFCTYD